MTMIMMMKMSVFVCRIAALLFLWVLAMVGGTLYKRFIMGAKGWEQVPLLNWYAAFGNLEAVSL